MDDDPISPEEMLAILMAGGRIRNERSYAIESRHYRNPEDSIEYEQEKNRKNEDKRRTR